MQSLSAIYKYYFVRSSGEL